MLEIVGLKLSMANVEKKSDRIPRIVDVSLDIEKVYAHTDGSLAVEFLYKVEYGPDCSTLKVGGLGFFRGDSELVGRAITEFRKSKKLSGELQMMISNPIGAEVGLNSIFILRPFGIMPHFLPPPIVTKEKIGEGATKNSKPKK
ncbi:MAG: hypothetical protein ACP5N9_05935 [Candidatus Bilamarchaeum sp.]|jgi:hypothetical protein